jgi:hypothetical protein
MDNITTPPVESVPESTDQPIPADEDKVTAVDVEPEETPSITPETPPAPLQDLDPLAELEKLQLDPKVKESLRSGYLRQADYTKKTQEIATDRKAVEAYKHWSPIIGFLEKNPAIANSLIKRNPADGTPPKTEYSDDPVEYAKQIRAEAIAEMKEEMRKDKEATGREQALNTEIAQAEKLDTRLTTDDVFSKMIAGWVDVNFREDIQSGRISVTEATKQALEAHKAYEESLRQKVLAEMNDKAKKKTSGIPGGNGSPLATAPKTGVMDMREAAKLAEEEIGRS